ncbi:hypothetical protein V8C42DRAFT_319831 [Trichoderma barbatum]
MRPAQVHHRIKANPTCSGKQETALFDWAMACMMHACASVGRRNWGPNLIFKCHCLYRCFHVQTELAMLSPPIHGRVSRLRVSMASMAIHSMLKCLVGTNFSSSIQGHDALRENEERRSRLLLLYFIAPLSFPGSTKVLGRVLSLQTIRHPQLAALISSPFTYSLPAEFSFPLVLSSSCKWNLSDVSTCSSHDHEVEAGHPDSKLACS